MYFRCLSYTLANSESGKVDGIMLKNTNDRCRWELLPECRMRIFFYTGYVDHSEKVI